VNKVGLDIELVWHNELMGFRTRTIACSLALGALLASGCATEPASRVVLAAQSNECVVLLHGLNRSWRAMRPMAQALQDDGYTTVNVDYPSQLGTIEELAPLAVGMGLDSCRSTGADKVHFVTHSMGGILVRYENERAPIEDIGRVVMLGPPNQGSEIVDRTREWPMFASLSGPAGLQLGTAPGSIPSQLGPVEFELGVIAGTGTISPLASAMLPDPDDGKVSVESTKVDGMQDFLIVDNSHRYITRSEIVVRNTRSFLRTGSFVDIDR